MNCSQLRRLLALTDFSAPARHAAERAAMLAAERGATLDLLHVMATAAMDRLRKLTGGVPTETEERLADAARDDLRELADVLHGHRGVSPDIHLVHGPLLASLEAQADQMDPDLMVLGARGSSYMRHLFLGSTAERMLRKMVRPMLVVKQQPHETYRRVLVPVDFSASSLRALRIAQAVVPGAEIVLLHAYEVPFEGKLQFAGVDDATIEIYRQTARQEAAAQLRHLVQDAGYPSGSVKTLILHGDPSRHIMEQEQERDCDLIVIGKHGESMIEELLFGSVTKRVLTESQGDVLVSM